MPEVVGTGPSHSLSQSLPVWQAAGPRTCSGKSGPSFQTLTDSCPFSARHSVSVGLDTESTGLLLSAYVPGLLPVSHLIPLGLNHLERLSKPVSPHTK